jgi:hypothetical protein
VSYGRVVILTCSPFCIEPDVFGVLIGIEPVRGISASWFVAPLESPETRGDHPGEGLGAHQGKFLSCPESHVETFE